MVDVLVTGFVVLFVLSVFGVGLYSERMVDSSDEFYGATKLFGAAVITENSRRKPRPSGRG